MKVSMLESYLRWVARAAPTTSSRAGRVLELGCGAYSLEHRRMVYSTPIDDIAVVVACEALRSEK